MSESPEKIIIDHDGRIITNTDAFNLDSDILYIRSDIVEKMLAEQRDACADFIYLPKITDDIAEDHADLISFEGVRPCWSQVAVDFACLLKQGVSVMIEKDYE